MKERSWLVLLAEMNKRQEINLKETKVFASFEDLFGQLIFTASFKVYHRDALACVHADRPLLLWEYVGLRHYISPANPICHQFLHSFSLKLSNALLNLTTLLFILLFKAGYTYSLKTRKKAKKNTNKPTDYLLANLSVKSVVKHIYSSLGVAKEREST